MLYIDGEVDREVKLTFYLFTDDPLLLCRLVVHAYSMVVWSISRSLLLLRSCRVGCGMFEDRSLKCNQRLYMLLHLVEAAC
jgi:hypothetical protein